MPHCYILQSKKLNRFYIGACQDNLNSRIEKHNNHAYGKHRFTAQASDWTLFIEIETTNYARAVRIERKIKAMKSRRYIETLIVYPELVSKIYNETIGT
ncbi:MAG: GIY-YIG nuclease family protein [Flavobacteriales bacterium]|nr:GIY-YIG nuclease family protein [Flavobacteriales bacterium]